MKTTTIYIVQALMLALAMIAGNSCSDDNFRKNGIGSTLETTDDYKQSSFLLNKDVWELSEATQGIIIKLRSHTDNTEAEYNVDVAQESDKYRLTIHIPRIKRIIDGDYDILAQLPSGKKFGARLTATFKDEMLYGIMSTSVVFRLDGEGTEENPYLINSADDFDMFSYGLYQDSLSHGYGLYFKQTASFDAPPVSDVYTGRNYAGYSFAGVYDGGGMEINLVYSGSKSSKDQNVGLFKMLYSGAMIKNLTINANMRGISNNGGAVAGVSDGSVALNDITVNGSLNDCDACIGGFIGQAKGKLTINRCRLYATVSAASNVGGVIGYFEGEKLIVNDFSNIKAGSDKGTLGITATGGQVGGIVGELRNSGCDFKQITLSHPISEEDIDIPVIYAGGSDVGGLIGKATINKVSSFINVQVVASVRSAANDVGGLVGNLKTDGDLTLKNCQFNSYLKGQENVGGFVGIFNASGKSLILDSQNYVRQLYNGGYLSIEASRYVGGIVGNQNAFIAVNSECAINAPVTAYSNFAGGIAGYVGYTTLKVGKFKIDSDMHIYGPDATGGLVGYADHATIEGDIATLPMDSSIPSPAQFVSNFPGTVSSGRAGSSSSSGTSMGGIVGYSKSTTIRGVCFTGSVFGSDRVGGIAGHMDNQDSSFAPPSVTDCVSNGKTVTNTSSTSTGGVIGKLDYKYGTYERLINYTRVEGAEYTGGVIGQVNLNDGSGSPSFTLSRAVNTGMVTGSKNVGGCVGYVGGSKAKDNRIEYSANYGSVSNNGDGHVGGILGYGKISHAIISACANHGAITGGSSDRSDVGGICGRFGQETSGVYVNDNIQLEKCCNRGTISSGHKNSYLGGILGRHAVGSDVDNDKWQTRDCYNSGAVTSDQKEDNGGIIGYVDHYSDVHRCINIGKVSYGNGCVGTRKDACIWHHHDLYYLEGTGKGWCADSFSSSDKQNSSKFKNFDFNSVWAIDSDGSKNDGYPYLRDCPYQSVYYK